MTIIVPIGVQCTNATFKNKINMGSETLPFDWMLSHPKFVYEMLKMLLDDNCDVNDLVTNHFFSIDKRAKSKKGECYCTCKDGPALLNSNHNVIFPHDDNSKNSIDKYVRRFTRLKNLILDNTIKLYFVYSSQSSANVGNFTIDGKEVISDVYVHLSKIYDLIGKYRDNYKIVVFDSVMKDNQDLLHPDIILCKLKSCNTWTQIVSQMISYSHIFS